MTSTIAARLNSRLTKLDMTRLMGKMNLGMYTFFDQGRITQHAAHAHVGAFVKKVEQGIAADQVQRKVRDVEPEHIGEHKRLQQHHKQRVENAPHIAQHAAAVFDLEVTGHQLADERPVFEKLCQLLCS